jgi:acyl dehydratase
MSRPRDTTFPGDELPVRRLIVTREAIAAYAEASGDRNPLHLDDAAARAVGFGSVIAHGMLTMGHLGAAVAAWAGDPADVVSFSANFREPVFPDEVLESGGAVRAIDDETMTATLDLWVRVVRDDGDHWPVKKAVAVVRLG